MYFSGTGMINTHNHFTSPPPSYSIHESKDDEMCIHYYQQDLTRAALTAPPALENYNSLYNFANQFNSDASTLSSLPPTNTKPAAHNFRKDRHSKIVTAQGPRDRRVRLSIPVARKFFHLHDTLGSDKASETLDWLLTKSQPAIDDLVKNKRSSCSTTVDEGWSRSHSTEAGDIGDKHYMRSKSVIMQHEEKARVSRAKARARARERTRQKMSIRHILETKKLLPAAHDYIIPSNYLVSTWNELSYPNKSMAPFFNAGTDQTRIIELCPETNSQTGIRLCETYNNKFSSIQQNN